MQTENLVFFTYSYWNVQCNVVTIYLVPNYLKASRAVALCISQCDIVKEDINSLNVIFMCLI